MSEPTTERGDNWSVFFFECPVGRIQQVLVDLSEQLRSVEEGRIPHFILREYAAGQHIGISLRVLREKEHAKEVDDKLAGFFEEQALYYERDPKGNRHGWIAVGTTSSHWDNKRCESLHLLSKLMFFLAKNDIFDASYRCHMAHYAVNLLILQEATLPSSNAVSFFDLITKKALSFKTHQLTREHFDP